MTTNHSLLDNQTSILGVDKGSPGLSAGQTSTSEFISDEVFRLFLLMVNVISCGLVSLLGMAGNVVNIGVFMRLGIWEDSSNVSLLGLAVSDFFYLLSLLGVSVCWAFYLINPPGLAWDPTSLQYAVFARSLTIFSDVTCWITAFLAFQRCLCVVMPFKVRVLFSSVRNLLIICSIFSTAILMMIPLYMTEKLSWVVNPFTNDTILALTLTEHHDKMSDITYYLNAIILRTVATITIIICTQITAYKVSKTISWRKSNRVPGALSSVVSTIPNKTEMGQDAGTDSAPNNVGAEDGKKSFDPTDRKERKLIKIIVMISMIFIACYTPEIFVAYMSLVIAGLSYGGLYHKLYLVLYYCCFFLGGINASINILVYLNMSTKYRIEVKKWFRFKK